MQINGTPAGYQTADSRNRIVNGAMQISQENGNSTVGNAAYPTDQWVFLNTTGSTALAQQYTTATSSSVIYRLRVLINSADASHAAAESMLVRTTLEGSRISDFMWGKSTALPAVLRFLVTASTAGVYSVAVRNIPVTESWIGTFTIAPEEVGLFVWKTVVIPPCLTGTWATDTAAGMYISFMIASGPSEVGVLGWQTGNKTCAPGQVNGTSATGNFAITNVGLYLDPDNTGVAPKWQMPDEAEELRACQRYWFKAYGASGPVGTTGYRYAGTAGLTFTDAGVIPFPTTMRVNAAGTIDVAPTYTNCSAGSLVQDLNASVFRVTATAVGSYRAISGVFSFNARM